MAVHVVTFADRRMKHMHRRFRSQARAMEMFATVSCLTEKSLESEFRRRFSSYLTPAVRGFGYFVWKPQVILQTLAKLPDGDILLYLDSGSHLVQTGRARFEDYLALVESSSAGMVAFQLSLSEKSWTKGDLLDHFGVRDNSSIVDTPQVQAGAIFLRNSKSSRKFIENWLRVFEEHFHLVDDTPSDSPNFPGFVAHRHDQSVFSVTAKLAGVSLLPAREQYPEHDPTDWASLSDYPIHHRRDKAKRWEKYASGLRKCILPFEVFLVRAKRLFLSMFSFNR